MADPVIKDSQVSMRLPGDLKARIETYAQLTGRSKSHVAMEALADYLDGRMPQVEDLKQAVAAADRGEFADDAAVAAVMARHRGAAAGAPPPAAAASTAAKRRRRGA